MSMNGKLVGIKIPGLAKEQSFVSVCPECDHPVKAKQQYVCPENDAHGPYSIANLSKAKETDAGLIAVSADAVAAAKKSDLPLNFLDLTVHPAAQVASSTFPSELAYVFYPKITVPQYGLLLDATAEPDLAFVGLCNLRNNEKLVKLTRWGDNLVVQTLFYPEDLNDRLDVAHDYSGDLLETYLKVITKNTTDFDPTVYRNNVKAKVAAAVAEAGGPVAAPVAPKPVADPEAALREQMAALMAEG